MRNRIIIGSAVALAVVAMLTATRASAQSYPEDKRVLFTFSGPVAVPGVTLPAGTYLFRLTNSIASGERHVIQVLSDNGKRSYAQFFGLSAVRTDYAPKPELRFMETAVGMPAAVKTWWYPGAKDGYEFIYPKDQARLLAKGTGEPVLTENPVEVERVTPAGAETAVRAEAPAAPTGPIVTGELAPQTTPVVEPTLEARVGLPRTASATGVIALAAMGFLLAAALVRGARMALN